MRLGAMTVVGIMSGTSADGIDVALTRITPARSGLELSLEAHAAFPFPPALRTAILAATETGPTTTAELARLNWRLGLAYADAVRETLSRRPSTVDLIGCHGQTVYHQGVPSRYAGQTFSCTWQLGEPALVARAIGVPVVSNFRPADMAVHGQGAPLVPLLDYTFFRHAKRARVLQNIGGIGNLSIIPAGAGPERGLAGVMAFDTGPGNMVMDAIAQELFSKPYDKGGTIAARGQVLEPVVQSILRQPFFLKPPPKSAGREQFGAPFTKRFIRRCRSYSEKPEDILRTATALTTASITLAFRKFVTPMVAKQAVDFVISGGGAKNFTLVADLRTQLEPLGATVSDTGAFGMPVEAKEAMAFALLAYQTWHHRPGNVTSATGADRAVILGQISYV
jgi:anhydro-N-acetylmuramic acid kinase